MSTSLPTAAVIGAGSSGIAATKALHAGAERARAAGFVIPVAA